MIPSGECGIKQMMDTPPTGSHECGAMNIDLRTAMSQEGGELRVRVPRRSGASRRLYAN